MTTKPWRPCKVCPCRCSLCLRPGIDSAPAAPVPQAQQRRTFTSGGGKVSFDYPAQWTVAAPPGGSGSSAVDVDVTDAEGMVVASLHYGPSGGIGGACQGPVPYTVLDSVELALPHNTSAADTITPRFAFRALQEADRVTASYGITSTVSFPSLEEARAYMQSSEYLNAKRMITSLKINAG